jgi:sulfite reductase beta subunit-like hemoprotein
MEEDLFILSVLRGAASVGLGLGTTERRGEPNIPEVQQQGVSFLGPHAIAMFVSAMEMGVIIACFARFIARSDKEKTRIKALVYFLTFVAACVRLSCTVVFDVLTPSNFSHNPSCHVHTPFRPWARTNEQAADGSYVRGMVEDLRGGFWQLGK